MKVHGPRRHGGTSPFTRKSYIVLISLLSAAATWTLVPNGAHVGLPHDGVQSLSLSSRGEAREGEIIGELVHEGVVAEASVVENKNRVGILDEGTISWDVVRKEDYVTVDGDDVLDVIDYLNNGGDDALYHEKRGETLDEEDYDDDDFGNEGKDKKKKGENDEDAEADDYDYGDYDEEDDESEGDYDEGREEDYLNEVYDAEEERDRGKRDNEDYDEEDYHEDAGEEEGSDGDLDDDYGEEDYGEQEERGENVANDDTDDYDDNEDYDGEEDYLRIENDGSDYGGKDSTKEYDMEKAGSASRQRQSPGRNRRNQNRDRTRENDAREGSGLDDVNTQNAHSESNRVSKLEHQDSEGALEEENKNDQSVRASMHDNHATSDPIDDLPATDEDSSFGIGAMKEDASLGGDMVSAESTERDRKESSDIHGSNRSHEQGEHSFGRDGGWKRDNTKLISVADSAMQYAGDGKNNTGRVEDEERWPMAANRADSRNGAGKSTVGITVTDVIEGSGFEISSTGVFDDDPSLAENDPSKFPQMEGSEIVHIADKNKNTSIAGDERNRERYHMVVSVGDGLYTEWQARVCYYWYKKVKAEYPDSALGGFTRLLHTGEEDEWMNEIPTIVVDPLPEDIMEKANGYVVLNRPHAFKQWVEKHMDTIPESYVLMAEPDHLLIKPPPLLATADKAAAFPFHYIDHKSKANERIVQRFNEKNIPLTSFFPVGNSPVMISKERMGPIVKRWVNISLAINADPEADSQWGWIQEMMAWSIASALDDQGPLQYNLCPELMLQPPWDSSLRSGSNGKDAYLIHYTYGFDFSKDGQFTPGEIGDWHWDKRDFIEKYPPLNFPMPPSSCKNEPVRKVIEAINEAAANLPGWEERAFKEVEEIPLYNSRINEA